MNRKTTLVLSTASFALLCSSLASAQGGCPDPSSGPDVIVGDLNGLADWGAIGDISAYSVGTTSCNVGDAELLWISSNPNHPVIGQNMYRIEDGRFEQIGQSWLKHGFTALQQSLCCSCQSSGTGSRLGVGCSDPYGAGLNGSQGGLGPRFEVNAHTGVFAYPFFAQGQTGNSIYKRLQVRTEDLDPTLHPDALYFAEGHYVTPDDAAASNQNNNASFRKIRVNGFSGGSWDISFDGSTQRERPAIEAWADHDASVRVEEAQVSGEGLFIAASRASDNGDGTWTYAYAIHNLNSDRSGGSFTVPTHADAVVSDLYFHDVPYHSGEPYDGTDWSGQINTGEVTWSGVPFATDANANALRWGTTYSFGFVSDREPLTVNASIGLFKPGSPDAVAAKVWAPTGPRAGSCVTSSYCVSSPNSVGPGAVIGASGTTSISANDFTVTVTGSVPLEFGIFFYGPAEISVPFGDGVQCVGAGATGLFRLLPPTTSQFDGFNARLVDFSVPPAGSGPGMISADETWNFQYWYRDPGAGGSGFNTSDGLSATFCP